VLSDIGRRRVDGIVCLGDIVGYGADPGPCLARIRQSTELVVAGNHDWGAVGKVDLGYFNRSARAAAEWTAQKITESERIFLSQLPLALEIPGADGFIAVHSTPDRPQEWRYILSIDEAEFQFERMNRPLCFVGHSHQPVAWQCHSGGRCSVVGREYLQMEPGRRYIVNVGSVGQPRDGDPRAGYAVFDDQRGEAVIHRVEYDLATTQAKILRAGLPARLAERLASGL
jgi:diadenosine tetraphosphatase ApaH/serine/threonine PP2A family protein phosphatase